MGRKDGRKKSGKHGKFKWWGGGGGERKEGMIQKERK
jgi:hypothetical protein